MKKLILANLKDIFKFKIAISSDCSLRCKHCFIDKTQNLLLSFSEIKKSLDFFFKLPPSKKKLEIYGGEPFLHFKELKYAILYAKKRANKLSKKLSIDIATNGTIISDEIVRFLKKEDIRISISIFGTAESHNGVRVFPDGLPSYDRVMENSLLLLKLLGNLRITAIICVYPQRVKHLFDDFFILYRKGFKIFNLECVSGVKWSDNNFKELKDNINRIKKFIFKNIKNDSFFVMFESFIPLIDKTYEDRVCPFYRDLELRPDGNFSFYPYAFIKNPKDIKKISIGNIKNGFKERFSNCYYSPISNQCIGCVDGYYILDGYEDGNVAYRIRNEELSNIMKEVIIKSNRYKKYSDYLKKIIYVIKKYY
jgi:sulfatase maturation enzyme AslB (radical SAM superfamily)